MRDEGRCQVSKRPEAPHVFRDVMMEDLVQTVVAKIGKGAHGSAETVIDLATESSKSLTTKAFFHSLLQSMVQSCSLDDIEWCLNLMIDRGTLLNTSSVNSMLHACAKVGNVALAEKWLASMPSHNLTPNAVSFNTMINTCARSLDTKRAEHWFQKMLEQGIKPTRITFGSLVDAFAKAGKLNEAEASAQKMADAGMAFDRIIYNSLLHAAAKAGNQAKAEHWLQQMIDDNIKPNERAFSSLICACSKSGNLVRATYWFNLMVESGCRVDMISFSSMINVSARVGDSQQAEHWMDQLISYGFTPNIICYNTLIHACARDNNYPRSVKWIKRLLEGGMKPNEITFNTMIQVSLTGGTWRDAEFWLMRMICEGHWPDNITLVTLARTSSRSAPQALKELPSWVNAAISAATSHLKSSKAGRRFPSPAHAQHFVTISLEGHADVERRAREVFSKPLHVLLEEKEGVVGAAGNTDLPPGECPAKCQAGAPDRSSRGRARKKDFDPSRFGTWPLKSKTPVADESDLPNAHVYASQAPSFVGEAWEEAQQQNQQHLFPHCLHEFQASTDCSASITNVGLSEQTTTPGNRRGRKDFDLTKFGTWPSNSQLANVDLSANLSFGTVSEENLHFESTNSDASTSSTREAGIQFCHQGSHIESFQKWPIQASGTGNHRANRATTRAKAFDASKFGTWPAQAPPIREQELSLTGLPSWCMEVPVENRAAAGDTDAQSTMHGYCTLQQPMVQPEPTTSALSHSGRSTPAARFQRRTPHQHWPEEQERDFSKFGTWPSVSKPAETRDSANYDTKSENSEEFNFDKFVTWLAPAEQNEDTPSGIGVFCPDDSAADSRAERQVKRYPDKKFDFSKFGTWPRQDRSQGLDKEVETTAFSCEALQLAGKNAPQGGKTSVWSTSSVGLDSSPNPFTNKASAGANSMRPISPALGAALHGLVQAATLTPGLACSPVEVWSL